MPAKDVITAKDIMTRKTLTVTPEMPVIELAKFFLAHRISGAPVVKEGRLLGLITEKELIEQKKRLHVPTVVAIMEAVVYLESSKHFEQELREIAASKVEDLYQRRMATVSPDTPIEDIATLMTEKGVALLPVVDENGGLAGIIGKADVVKAFLKP